MPASAYLSMRVAKRFLTGLVALAPMLSMADVTGDPMNLLGQPLTEIAAGATTVPASLSDADLDELFDMPAARSLDILLSAEPKGRAIRGGKGVDINRRVAPATVFLQQGAHLCSGTLVDAEGRILTCWHCVRSGGDILVRLHPDVTQRPLTRARLLRADPGRDLALLQLAEVPSHIKSLELGRATDIEVGTDVYAVGHPSGLAWSIVKGMVSQIHEKRVWTFEQNRHEAEVIQSQIPLYPGNSGGPLVTDHGLLIGVNAARRENESFTFAISISEVRSFLGGVATAPEVLTHTATSCKRRKLAEGRNVENTASVTLYDTDCDGKADTALFIPDDSMRPLTVARAGEGGGQINVVRTGRDGRHSTYILGKKSAIRLDETLKTETLPAPVR
jgi:S1-C subfamily serine protease